MRKTGIAMILITAMMLMLAGCGHRHDFQPVSCDKPLTCTICGATQGEPIGHTFGDATCTEPAKCIRCGEIGEEALGHDFAEATCTQASTCRRCGTVEGVALGHILSEATYQDAPVCSRCGETVGEPLTPSFVEHGLTINAALDTDIPYVTGVMDNDEDVTVGTARFEDFRRFKGDDMFPATDGYEWLSVRVSIDFSDEAAAKYGYTVGPTFDDYYTTEKHDETAAYIEAVGDKYADFDEHCTYTINYHGEEYVAESLYKLEESGWQADKHAHVKYVEYVHVPEGYDGTVVGLYHFRNDTEWMENQYIYDIADKDTIFFRMDPALATAS